MKSPRFERSFARVDTGLLKSAFCVVLLTAPADGQETTRVSVDSWGVEGNKESRYSSISADGQIVAFMSVASNLVSSDTNGVYDVFVHDRSTGLTERVSVDSSGAQGNGESKYASISADGRFVAFQSYASNLVAGDRNRSYDIFVHDRSTGLIERVSMGSSGAEGNNHSRSPAISADGQVVAFYSGASNLVSGDRNKAADVFIRERLTGITQRVSVDSSGAEGNRHSYTPSISADGQIVAFSSDARYLVSGDTNWTWDVFVHDRSIGLTERVSVHSSGAEGNSMSGWYSSISADGQIVAFESWASNLVFGDTNGTVDVFVHHRSTGVTERVSVDSSGAEGNGWSMDPSISADGQIVAFESDSSDLVAGDTNAALDVFVHEPRCKVDASWSNYGAGFPGSSGVPAFTSRGNPVLGSTLTLDLANSYGNDTPGLFLVGYQEAVIPTNRGGDLLLIPAEITLLNVRWLGITIEGDVPDQDELCGIEVFLQVLEIDPGAIRGVSFTAGLKLVLGD